MPRHFLRDDDLTPDELGQVLDLAAVSTTARHSPVPRRAAISGLSRASRACARCSPTRLTESSRCSAAIVVRTASAAAHDTGLPPNVLP